MSNLQLADLFPIYPSYDDPEIQTKITNKKEFYQLKSPMKDNPNKVKAGKTFNHQELALRYMTIYDRLLEVDDAGTGKTRLAFNISEYFRKLNDGLLKTYRQSLGLESKIKRCVILVKNSDL